MYLAADLLSRQGPPPGEWRLHPEVVDTIWHRYGRAEVDLHVSEALTQWPLWFSLRETTESPTGLPQAAAGGPLLAKKTLVPQAVQAPRREALGPP